jgi:DNA invertase Pin-like site-specific DNA recombinase
MREGYSVAREYWDKAISGRTDKRPWFQAMVRNAPESDVVVVYAMDRFSRDMYDAPIYKKALSECGVHVVSATENIDSTPEGVFMEKVMEGWAAYYSLNLSRSVMRGMTGNAMACKANGVRVFGYRVGEDGRYAIDEAEAPVVVEVFERYIACEPLHAIAADLASHGVVGTTGKPMDSNALHRMVRNRKYTGEYSWGGIVVPGGMPRIVDDATFAKARRSIPRKRRKAEEWDEYALTGKLWCGICGKHMMGVSGRGKMGVKYDYYACPTDGCIRNVPKQKIEGAIRRGIEAMMRDPDISDAVARRACEVYDTSGIDARIEALESSIRDARRGIQGIEDAICRGMVTDGLKTRLEGFQGSIAEMEPELERLKEERDSTVDVEMVSRFLREGLSSAPDLVLGKFVGKVVLFEEGAALTMSYRQGEECEPAEFSLMGDEFAHIAVGRPPELAGEPMVTCIPGGIAVLFPLCA